MKKLFTLVVAMALVSMSFAQGLLINTNTQVQLPENQRSDWYGFYATSGSVFVMAAESEYCLRIPEGEIPAGAQLERVRFYHTTSDHVTGNNVPTFNNETYVIRIYTGTVYDAENSDITPGTLVYSQNYTVPDGDDGLGINVCELATPFTMPATGDVTVSIYAAEAAAVCLCPTDEDCADNNFALFGDRPDDGYHHWVFGSEYDENNQLIASHKPFLLTVYYNDGQAYQPKSDLYAEIYDPQDEQTYPDELDEDDFIVVDQYTDSLYFYGGAFNTGVDPAIGYYTLSLYIDGETPFYFPDLENAAINDEPDTLEMFYGWRWHFNLLDWDLDADVLAPFGWPNEDLHLCMHIGYESTAEYNGVDPNLNNNTFCATYHYDNGIKESNNALNVYPNPACNEITIDNAAGAQVSIYNVAGQEVMSIENANASATINVANLTEGLYIVRVVNGNEVATSKVNIVR
jgi:hypothetical protein